MSKEQGRVPGTVDQTSNAQRRIASSKPTEARVIGRENRQEYIKSLTQILTIRLQGALAAIFQFNQEGRNQRANELEAENFVTVLELASQYREVCLELHVPPAESIKTALRKYINATDTVYFLTRSRNLLFIWDVLAGDLLERGRKTDQETRGYLEIPPMEQHKRPYFDRLMNQYRPDIVRAQTLVELLIRRIYSYEKRDYSHNDFLEFVQNELLKAGNAYSIIAANTEPEFAAEIELFGKKLENTHALFNRYQGISQEQNKGQEVDYVSQLIAGMNFALKWANEYYNFYSKCPNDIPQNVQRIDRYHRNAVTHILNIYEIYQELSRLPVTEEIQTALENSRNFFKKKHSKDRTFITEELQAVYTFFSQL